MPVLLQVQNINKSFGARPILKDASASFASDQKIGVIGRNGAGKSTLCRIITGEEEQDSGSIIRNRQLKLSYLEQHDPYTIDEILIDFLTRYTGKEEWECGEMAGKFQIGYDMLYAPIKSLAGGFQTRVKLAAMLLGDPNFLILDEPTNYLDLSTLILLENLLLNFKGGFLIVSHDREFLKRTCNHTLEVEVGELTLYPGPIEEYLEFKEEQLRLKQLHNRTIEKKREQLQGFVDRFKAKASTASRAKSKMKQIDRLESIEIAHAASNVRIRIPPVEPKAGIALSCEKLAIGYPEKMVADNIFFEIDRGEKVAVLGDNGQGKTTLFRTIADDLAKKGGRFKWGAGLKIAYYAQHVFQVLHPEDTVFSHLQREAVDGVSNQNILDMAGCFLFKGDDIKKKVGILSGGERARLCLAGLLLGKSQILLLDEPTNHLDFETVEALAQALKEYKGTVFFISHDRTFVHMIATNILNVKDGTVVRYPGHYDDYVYSLEREARELNGIESASSSKKKSSVKNVDKEKASASESKANPKQMDGGERKKVQSEIKKLQTKMKKIEKRMAHMTKDRDAIHEGIQKNPFHYSKDRNERLKEVTIQIEEDEDIWGKTQNQIEKLEKKL